MLEALKLSALVNSVITGESYDHPSLRGTGRFGRAVDVKAAAGTRDMQGLLPGNKNIFIADVLRPPLILQAAGAVAVDGVGPENTTIGSIDNLEARWLVDNQSVPAADVSTSAGTIGDSISIARVEFSRRFKLQSPAGEALLRQSMQRAMTVALEKAGIVGTGGWQPQGLINDSAIYLETGPVTAAGLIADAERLVRNGCDPSAVSIIASADDMAGLLSNGVSNEGRTTTGALHNAKGFGVRFSPYLLAGQSIAGQFNQLSIIYYESPQIIVDPFTEGASGKTRISIFQACSLAAAHRKAFVRRIAS